MWGRMDKNEISIWGEKNKRWMRDIPMDEFFGHESGKKEALPMAEWAEDTLPGLYNYPSYEEEFEMPGPCGSPMFKSIGSNNAFGLYGGMSQAGRFDPIGEFSAYPLHHIPIPPHLRKPDAAPPIVTEIDVEDLRPGEARVEKNQGKLDIITKYRHFPFNDPNYMINDHYYTDSVTRLAARNKGKLPFPECLPPTPWEIRAKAPYVNDEEE